MAFIPDTYSCALVDWLTALNRSRYDDCYSFRTIRNILFFIYTFTNCNKMPDYKAV